MNPRRLLFRISQSQGNVRFGDLERLVISLGFRHDHTAGSHRIFIHKTHRDAQLNLQPVGGQAKPYQVRQLLKLVEQYNLQIED
ncbi:MAG: type II toxin-antitoxin system HicA family toxin [Phycisphaeraceae bacterium]|nr:type II toxin-antitoxin system HicA family toxin [Phycisphaeraceae bacterium]